MLLQLPDEVLEKILVMASANSQSICLINKRTYILTRSLKFKALCLLYQHLTGGSDAVGADDQWLSQRLRFSQDMTEDLLSWILRILCIPEQYDFYFWIKRQWNECVYTDSLRVCCEQGWLKPIEILNQFSADARRMFQSIEALGFNPLVIICGLLVVNDGHLAIVRFLLDRYPDLIHVDKSKPLRYAAKRGHIHLVKMLVEAGAQSDSVNNYAVFRSAVNGHVDVVRFLLENGLAAPPESISDEPALEDYLKTQHRDIWELLSDYSRQQRSA